MRFIVRFVVKWGTRQKQNRLNPLVERAETIDTGPMVAHTGFANAPPLFSTNLLCSPSVLSSFCRQKTTGKMQDTKGLTTIPMKNRGGSVFKDIRLYASEYP